MGSPGAVRSCQDLTDVRLPLMECCGTWDVIDGNGKSMGTQEWESIHYKYSSTTATPSVACETPQCTLQDDAQQDGLQPKGLHTNGLRFSTHLSYM